MNTKNVYRFDVSEFTQSVVTPGQMQSVQSRPYTPNEFLAYKRFAAKAARELGYGNDVSRKILEAKSEAQVTRMLVDARHKQR